MILEEPVSATKTHTKMLYNIHFRVSDTNKFSKYVLEANLIFSNEYFRKYLLNHPMIKRACLYTGISPFSPVSIRQKYSLLTFGAAPHCALRDLIVHENAVVFMQFMRKGTREKFIIAVEKELSNFIDGFQEEFINERLRCNAIATRKAANPRRFWRIHRKDV